MNEDDLRKIEALEERLDIELSGFRILAEKTEELLKQALELEAAVKELYK